MRNLVTAVIAVAISVLLAGIVAVVLAEYLRAQVDFALVFMTIAPLALVCAVPLLIASFRAEPRLAAARVGRTMLALFALLLLGLFGYVLFIEPRALPGDLPIIIALCVTGYVVLLTQWTLFHWRAPPRTQLAPLRFGRVGAPR